MGLLVVPWSLCMSFRLPPPNYWSLLLAALLGALALIYRTVRPDARIANYALCTALLCIFPDLAARLTYLTVSLAAPLQDNLFARLDRALGFDWTSYLHFATNIPWQARLLHIGYLSFFFQTPLSMLAFMAKSDIRRNLDLINATLITLLATIAISTVLPAYGAWEHYGALPPKPENIDVQLLRSGAQESFVAFHGVVSFPSFHMAMLVLILHAHRGRWTFWPFACVNAVMLPSIPIEGGHYAVDLLGGVIVAVGSILTTGLIRQRYRQIEADDTPPWCDQSRTTAPVR